VLLAGDAAHTHLPAGGEGLSLGVQDAANLGWKLAATVRGWAPPGLLDSYHTERHPVGERVLRNTLAQGTLHLSGAEIEPLREIAAELMTIPDVGRHLSGMVSGLDIRYDLGVTGHPLVGTRMPDAVVTPVDGPTTTVAQLLRPARATFITSPGGAPRRSVEAWRDRVRAHAVHAFPDLGVDRPTDAVLVRPDGYVAWAAPGCGDVGAALHRWFGLARDLRQLAA
jgi:bifunctional hydroxylase/dehydrase